MISEKILYSLFIGFLIYSFGLFFWGKSGVSPMREMMKKEESIAVNIEALKKRNKVLTEELELLKSSREIIRLKARDLNYYRENEEPIIIKQYSNPTETLNPGIIRPWSFQVEDREKFYQTLGLGIGVIAILFISAVSALFHHGHKRR